MVRYPLFHGMRSRRTAEQIKREGFCSYNEPNEAQAILRALNFFGKRVEDLPEGFSKDTIKMNIETVDTPRRKATYASADRTAACGWWAHANPEHISESLYRADVDPRYINKYLNRQYGDKCYVVKLKKYVEMSPVNPPPNVSIEQNCIPPEMIDDVRECGFCNYAEARKMNKGRRLNSQRRLGPQFGFEW